MSTEPDQAHHQAFADNLWGLEDSHLGALLIAHGLRLVPCPSAMAFKIEHPEAPSKLEFELPRHRQLYAELLLKPVSERAHEVESEIQNLEREGLLRECE